LSTKGKEENSTRYTIAMAAFPGKMPKEGYIEERPMYSLP